MNDAQLAGVEGMEAVKNAGLPWHDATLARIKQLATDFEGTFEDLRVQLENEGWPAPHHHNAWGAVAWDAKRIGYLVGTGVYRHMKTPKSHGRVTEVLLGCG